MGKITLVRGAFHPHLEDRLFEDILSARQTPLDPVVVLVGSNLLARYLSRKLAAHIQDQSGPAGHMGIRFLTFSNLSDELTERIHGRPIRALDRTAKRIAVRSCMTSNSFEYFEEMSDRPGLHEAMTQTIVDLEEARVSPEDLLRISEEGKVLGHSRQKLKDTAHIYRSVLDSYSGEQSSASLLLSAAHNAPEFEELYGTKALFTYGVYDFVGTQQYLLEEISKTIDVTFYIPSPSDKEMAGPGDFTRSAVEWIKGLGAEMNSIESPAPSQADIQVISAPGIGREVEETARILLGEASNTPFDEMLVLYRGGTDYPGRVKEVFQRAGIPYNGPDSTTPLDSHAGRLLQALLGLPSLVASNSLSRSALLDLTALLGEPYYQWEEITREAGITAYPSDAFDRLDRLLASTIRESEDPNTLDRVKSMLKAKAKNITRFLAFLRKLGSNTQIDTVQGTWAAIGEAVKTALLQAWGKVEKSLILSSHQISERSEVLPKLIAAIDHVAYAGSTVGSNCDIDEFALELVGQLEGDSGSIGNMGAGVTVSDVMKARGISAKTVVILGLNEGVFPMKSRQDPILLDRERVQVNLSVAGKDGAPLPLSLNRSAEETLLFSQAIAGGTEKVFLTYPRLDSATGKNNLPSHLLLSELSRRYDRQLKIEDLTDLDCFIRVRLDQVAASDPASAIDIDEYDLAAVSAGKDATKVNTYLEESRPITGPALKSINSRLSKQLGPYDGVLDTHDALAAAKERIEISGWSPSRLESWAKCPYAFFAEKILGVRHTDRPEELKRISPLDEGSAVHSALQRFLTELSDKKELPLKESALASYRHRLTEIVLEEIESHLALDPVNYRLLNESQRDRVLENIVSFLDREVLRAGDDSRIPILFEHTTKETALSSNGKTLKYAGRVDRIDAEGGDAKGSGIHVIDYKSGKAKDASSLEAGTNLQPALYLKAAVEELGADMSKSEASYMMTSSTSKKAKGKLEGSDWALVEQKLGQVIEIIMQSCEDGLFVPAPKKDASNCTWCAYKIVCAMNTPPPYEYKSTQSALRPIQELREIT